MMAKDSRRLREKVRSEKMLHGWDGRQASTARIDDIKGAWGNLNQGKRKLMLII
jgi:hypothetical protein